MIKNTKLVLDVQNSQAIIYYHDEVKNVAKLLVDQMALFKINDNSEFIQSQNIMNLSQNLTEE